uniref:Uncharacterized protein n=1 Tax=Cacopsylla melanoneura TaxID=428564 RepID=A0A8D9AKF6_9HEMI
MTVFKMEQDIRDVLELTLKDHLSLCGYYAAVADSPPMMIKKDEFLGKGVQYKPYDYTVHVAMACMCGITYLGPVIILTVSLCLEKMTGAYTRCLVGDFFLSSRGQSGRNFRRLPVHADDFQSNKHGFDDLLPICRLSTTLWSILVDLFTFERFGIEWNLLWFLHS